MAELLVSHPRVNSDFLRSHTSEDEWLRDKILLDLNSPNISEKKYPLACDLSAGNAYVAYLLNISGWNERKITCFDICKPDKPFVRNVTWEYWDLDKLGYAIKNNTLLPSRVEQARGKFDIAMMVCGGVEKENYGRVLRFFLRSGGIAGAWPYEDVLGYDVRHWKIVNGTDLLQKIS